MAGKATVTVELLDGTKVSYESAWTGGNPRLDAWEFSGASEAAAEKVRAAIAAMHGDINPEGRK